MSENSQSQFLIAANESITKKHKSHRNRVKMMADVLESARNGSLKTHIMYSSNLSYSNLTEILTFLLENGLLREEYDAAGRGASMTKYYYTTEKGQEFLEKFSLLHGLLSDSENSASEQFHF
ncbi:MAG: winged helix-turn-helix domain-containing protein [Nitrososphaerales archaeon]